MCSSKKMEGKSFVDIEVGVDRVQRLDLVARKVVGCCSWS